MGGWVLNMLMRPRPVRGFTIIMWDGAPSAIASRRRSGSGRTPVKVASDRGVVGEAAGLPVGELRKNYAKGAKKAKAMKEIWAGKRGSHPV
jgi:hypothetical protein